MVNFWFPGRSCEEKEGEEEEDSFLPFHLKSLQNDQLKHLSLSTLDHSGITDSLKNLVESLDPLLRKKSPLQIDFFNDISRVDRFLKPVLEYS